MPVHNGKLDMDESLRILCILCVSDRPHIKDIGKVERMQDPYVELLRIYSSIRHPNVRQSFYFF